VIPENIFSVAHTINGTGSFLRQMPGLSASHVQTAAAVGATTSLTAQSAAADGSP